MWVLDAIAGPSPPRPGSCPRWPAASVHSGGRAGAPPQRGAPAAARVVLRLLHDPVILPAARQPSNRASRSNEFRVYGVGVAHLHAGAAVRTDASINREAFRPLRDGPDGAPAGASAALCAE